MTSDRPPPRRRAASDEDDDDEDAPAPPSSSSSIADELLRRHGRSPQPSSARLIALLKATLDVLASRGLSATPGALFAALMPALETELQSGAQRDEKTLAALLALLDAVLPRVPEAVIVSRFAGAARILSAAVRATTTATTGAAGEDNATNDAFSSSSSSSSASAARHAVAALATATAAAAHSVVAAADWPGAPAPAFALLLQLTLDSRPKVRRAAASGVVRTLEGLRRGALAAAAAASSSAAAAAAPSSDAARALARLPASAPYPSAAEAVLALARAVLPAPAAAARAAAAAPAGAAAARSAADAAVRRSVLDCLHCLALLRETSSLLPAAAAAALPPLVAPLFELGSPALTRAAGDALAALASVEQQQQQQRRQQVSSSSSSSSLLPSASLVALVRSLAASPGAWSDGRDAVATASVCDALASAMRALRSADAAAAAAELPGAVSALCGPLTAAGSADGARGAAAAALLSVVEGSAAAACAVAAASGKQQQQQRQQKPLAVRVAAALAGALSPRSRAGWALALPSAAAFFDAAAGEVRSAKEDVSSSPACEAAALLLERVGELVAGANDAAERRENEEGGEDEERGALDFAAPAAAALGRALRSLGPRFVLSVLPLNILEALDGGDSSSSNSPEPRTWMLPLLRQHASGGSLRFWGDEILPLARACGDRAGAAAAAGDARRATACRALEAQAWATLPTFACWALDGGDALSTHAQAIARAFAAREDLRAPICAALTRLCDQALEVVRREGGGGGGAGSDGDKDEEEVVLSDDESDSGGSESESESDYGESDSDSGDDSDLDAAAASTPIAAKLSASRPQAYTPAVAAATLAVLRSQARNWLPLLLNAFVASPPQARAPAAAAVASLSQSPLCASRRAVEAMFGSALTKLAAATRDAAADPPVPNGKAADGGETPGERRATFLGAALALSSGLSSTDEDFDDDGGDDKGGFAGGGAGIDALWDAAVDAAGDREQAVQKSAYRVLAALLARERGRSMRKKEKKTGKAKRGGRKAKSPPSWLEDNLDRVLSDLLSGAPAALPAAKRHRLAAVREAVRAARRQRGGLRTAAAAAKRGGRGGSDDDEETDDDPVAALVAEAVLCVKEPNRRTRAAAYELLVDLGRPSSSASASLTSGDSTPLADLVALICGGLAAGASSSASAEWGGAADASPVTTTTTTTTLGPASPHVASAAVMALARLLHAYPSELSAAGAQLLPAVLPLLRSRSRELVKAVLGFAKVAASRLPVSELLGDDDDEEEGGDGDGAARGGDDVEMGEAPPSLLAASAAASLGRKSHHQQQHHQGQQQRSHSRLKQLLEALLAWSDDPKNKFRLRVRLVVERLVRRLGADAVSSAMPAGDARLLAHIRKAEARKARRRGGGKSRAGDDEDEDEEDDDGMLFDDNKSARRGGAAGAASRSGRKTAATRSEWAHTAVFGAATTRRDAASTKAGGGGGKRNLGGNGARLPGDGGRGRDPLDLLGAGAARALAAAPRGGAGDASRRSRGGGGGGDDDESRPLPLAPDGRLMISAEEAATGNGSSKKRKALAAAEAADGYDSGDSDFDDVRGAAVDARAAWRATAGARSLASGAARSVAASAKSAGGRSARTDATKRTSSSSRGGGAHSAERFRASKGGASGDVVRNKKGSKSGGKGGAVEPYAYWPLDRKMLNRRPTKARVAAGGLEKVVAAGRAGAKAAARDAKRRRK